MVPLRPLLGIAVTALLFAAETASAQAVDPDDIAQAVEHGVLFLKHGQNTDGTWTNVHKTGATALIAIALLECDVESSDPAVQSAAAFVRKAAEEEGQTYDISLAIMLLDRLGGKKDEALIGTLTKRLLMGQNGHGGWSYSCPLSPPPAPGQSERLRGQQGPPREGEVGQGAAPVPMVRPVSPQLGEQFHPQVDQANAAGGDNSNTQFALLALWVAKRHDLKVEIALRRVGQRFRASQDANGGWSYSGNSGTSPAMTCSGLLGLAVAYGVANQARAAREAEAERKESRKPGPGTSRGPVDPNRDPAVRGGLVALGAMINGPFIDGRRMWTQGPPPGFGGQFPINGPRAAGGQGGPMPRNVLKDDRDFTDYYFLWSLERVAMTYSLKTIGRKDWYEWGAKILLQHRRVDNSWKGAYDAKIDTSFALLFLRRSNLVSDLSSSLRGKVSDPSEVKLHFGGTSGADLHREDDTARQGAGKKQARRDPNAPLSADPEADRLARSILKASADAQQSLIEDLRDSKGSANTLALAAVIPHLSGPVHQKARDALVMRLTRMTSNTLRDKLQDDDLEIRRAAALAAAMKEEKTLIPDLIALLEDAEPHVSKAAQAALKALTKKDFGPDAGASDADRARAIAQWKEWWAKRK